MLKTDTGESGLLDVFDCLQGIADAAQQPSAEFIFSQFIATVYIFHRDVLAVYLSEDRNADGSYSSRDHANSHGQ